MQAAVNVCVGNKARSESYQFPAFSSPVLREGCLKISKRSLSNCLEAIILFPSLRLRAHNVSFTARHAHLSGVASRAIFQYLSFRRVLIILHLCFLFFHRVNVYDSSLRARTSRYVTWKAQAFSCSQKQALAFLSRIPGSAPTAATRQHHPTRQMSADATCAVLHCEETIAHWHDRTHFARRVDQERLFREIFRLEELNTQIGTAIQKHTI